MKVSFDFDGTLGHYESVQKYAKKLVEEGLDVWIVTRRYDKVEKYTDEFTRNYRITNLEQEHNYLFEVARFCGIKPQNIQFMNMEDKYLFFKDKNFIWHLDDDYEEILQINRLTKTKAISVNTTSWTAKCKRLISNIKK